VIKKRPRAMKLVTTASLRCASASRFPLFSCGSEASPARIELMEYLVVWVWVVFGLRARSGSTVEGSVYGQLVFPALLISPLIALIVLVNCAGPEEGARED